MSIHATAIIDKHVELADGVSVGPFAVIRGRVRIGRNTKVESHAIIGSEHGIVEIGEDCHLLSGSAVGGPPQDVSFRGEATKLVLGNRNIIREFATLNVGTKKGGGLTKLGDDNMIMSCVHIAHDCILGSRIIIANTCSFAGHVTVEDDVRIGGHCAFAQFRRIGRFGYVAGDSTINKDLLPFTISQGKYAVARGTNKIGMERAGFSEKEIENVHRAVRAVMMGKRSLEAAVEKIQAECEMTEPIQHIIKFIQTTEHGIGR